MSQDESGILGDNQSVVAVGGNLPTGNGGVSAAILDAIQTLECGGISVLAVSKLYQTPCFPVGNGPDFVNAAILIQSEWSPEQLLQHLHKIETDFGRKRAERWGARVLDLDLIASGGLVRPNPEAVQDWIDLSVDAQMKQAPEQLILPHPRLQDRGFVLIPFADIAPHWRHPILGKTVMEMLKALPEAEKTSIQALT